MVCPLLAVAPCLQDLLTLLFLLGQKKDREGSITGRMWASPPLESDRLALGCIGEQVDHKSNAFVHHGGLRRDSDDRIRLPLERQFRIGQSKARGAVRHETPRQYRAPM